MDEKNTFAIQKLRRWAHMLDEAFRVPGTGFRFGWDPILGLIPGMGDAITAMFSFAIVWASFRTGIPGVIKARMLINLLIDMIVGAIPLLGDLFDFAWKANTRNLQLLESHALDRKAVSAGDWAFVLGAVLVLAAGIAVPFLVVWALARGLAGHWLHQGPSWDVLLLSLRPWNPDLRIFRP